MASRSPRGLALCTQAIHVPRSTVNLCTTPSLPTAYHYSCHGASDGYNFGAIWGVRVRGAGGGGIFCDWSQKT